MTMLDKKPNFHLPLPELKVFNGSEILTWDEALTDIEEDIHDSIHRTPGVITAKCGQIMLYLLTNIRRNSQVPDLGRVNLEFDRFAAPTSLELIAEDGEKLYRRNYMFFPCLGDKHGTPPA